MRACITRCFISLGWLRGRLHPLTSRENPKRDKSKGRCWISAGDVCWIYFNTFVSGAFTYLGHRARKCVNCTHKKLFMFPSKCEKRRKRKQAASPKKKEIKIENSQFIQFFLIRFYDFRYFIEFCLIYLRIFNNKNNVGF